MGEAKRRGNYEQRQAAAVAAMRAKFPASITCNSCQAELRKLDPVDVAGLPGMRAAGIAHCPACSHDTWVLDGTPAGLAMFSEFLNAQLESGPVGSAIVRR